MSQVVALKEVLAAMKASRSCKDTVFPLLVTPSSLQPALA